MLDYSILNLPKKQHQIVKTALDLFQRFGIKRITIEEICQTASVSKMTFYKYFKNKNELVRFLWEKGFEQAFAKFDAICGMDISFEKKLQLMLKLKEESTANISHQFALDYFYASPDLKDFFDKLAHNNITRFLDFLKTAQKKGEVRHDLRPEFLMAIINNIKLLVKDEPLINSYPSYHDFVMEVNNFLFYGILPRPDFEKS
jgi:AcrR family transcriptional regulator